MVHNRALQCALLLKAINHNQEVRKHVTKHVIYHSPLISFTRLAVELATSLADWTKCRFATGFVVLEDASRHALQRELVCLAITVAADNTWQTLHL